MAMTINEQNLIKHVIETIPLDNIELLANTVPDNVVVPLLSFIAT